MKMLPRNMLVAAGLAACVMTGQAAHAQPTSTNSISLQAKLTGVPDGMVNIAVRFYDALTGGTQVGSTITLTTVPVQGGIVSVPVSPVDATTFNGSTRYMGISVNGGAELSPRTLVTSVPYAASALRASQLDSPGPAGASALELRRFPICYLDMTRTPNEGRDYDYRLYVQDDDPRFIIASDIHPAAFVIRRNGFVGIGVDAPFEALDVEGNIRARGNASVGVLTIRGGADVAEPIAITPTEAVAKAQPGMVMVIDREHDGKLVPCSAAYDKAVAGVLSGANGLKPGMVLSAEGQPHTGSGDDTMPLAMTGRVWVWCDATTNPVRRGDSLTTAATPGHAMAVTDDAKRPGAVIGKAMTELKDGKGLVLVLVNLQ